MNIALKDRLRECLQSGETFEYPGSLTIDKENISALPAMKIGGDLKLTNLSHLLEIKGLDVAGDLLLDSVDTLQSLPAETKVGGTLTLRFNTLLSDLGKITCKHLVIDSGLSASIFDFGIEGIETVDLRNCQNLEIITQSFNGSVPLDVSFYNCGIRSIPSRFKVGRSLAVLDCENLRSVGSGVFVGDELDLSDCKELKSIGSNLFVGGDLIVRNTGLEELPEDISVGGSIEVEGSPIKNLRAISKSNRIMWRRKDVGIVEIGEVSKQMAEKILKLGQRNLRERAIRQMGTEAFLKAVGEKFSSLALDPGTAMKVGQDAADLYFISKGRRQWAYDLMGGSKNRLPRYNEAGIMMTPGWWEIRNTRLVNWQRN